jgi:hypothetical protein
LTNALTPASCDQQRTLGARRMTTMKGGKKTPVAETSAPARPATRAGSGFGQGTGMACRLALAPSNRRHRHPRWALSDPSGSRW